MDGPSPRVRPLGGEPLLVVGLAVLFVGSGLAEVIRGEVDLIVLRYGGPGDAGVELMRLELAAIALALAACAAALAGTVGLARRTTARPAWIRLLQVGLGAIAGAHAMTLWAEHAWRMADLEPESMRAIAALAAGLARAGAALVVAGVVGVCTRGPARLVALGAMPLAAFAFAAPAMLAWWTESEAEREAALADARARGAALLVVVVVLGVLALWPRRAPAQLARRDTASLRAALAHLRLAVLGQLAIAAAVVVWGASGVVARAIDPDPARLLALSMVAANYVLLATAIARISHHGPTPRVRVGAALALVPIVWAVVVAAIQAMVLTRVIDKWYWLRGDDPLALRVFPMMVPAAFAAGISLVGCALCRLDESRRAAIQPSSWPLVVVGIGLGTLIACVAHGPQPPWLDIEVKRSPWIGAMLLAHALPPLALLPWIRRVIATLDAERDAPVAAALTSRVPPPGYGSGTSS